MRLQALTSRCRTDAERDKMDADSVHTIEEEAQACLKTLSQLTPEVRGLKKKLDYARFLMKHSKFPQMPQVKWLECQLEALQTCVTEMQSDLMEIDGDTKTVLGVKVDSSKGSPLGLNLEEHGE